MKGFEQPTFEQPTTAEQAELTPETIATLKHRLSALGWRTPTDEAMKLAEKIAEKDEKGKEVEVSFGSLKTIAAGMTHFRSIEEMNIDPEQITDTRLQEKLAKALSDLRSLEGGVSEIQEKHPKEVEEATEGCFDRYYRNKGGDTGVYVEGKDKNTVIRENTQVFLTFGSDAQLQRAMEELRELRKTAPKESALREFDGSFGTTSSATTRYQARIDGAMKELQDELDRRAAK